MLRPLSVYLDRIDSIYRNRPYFDGLKARLLAGICWLLLVFVPLNLAKIIWIHPPMPAFRWAFTLCLGLAALLSLRWVRKGRLEFAGNGLVLVTTLSIHFLSLLVPGYPNPLSAAILMFACNLVFMLLALVFASRLVAAGMLTIIAASQYTAHVRVLESESLTAPVQFAADTLFREGSIAMGMIFFLGMTLVRMIEASHRRSEESLIQTRTVNENLGLLVTERTRDLEAAILRANEASRAKSDFLANMSHEIRTPLNGIIASADLLHRRSDLSAEAAEHVRLIADSGELLLKQLGDVLDFSKIEAGQLVMETHRFELGSLVSDCVALVAAKALETKIRLDYTVEPLLLHHFDGDSFRLRQVLLNLISNAIKFTPAGGRVQVTVSAAAPQANPVQVHFEVRDTGIGMDESTMKQIFQRFTQADSSTTRRYGGTGLGLAISSRIVEMMGGRIHAESTPHRGSTFHFTVPFRRADLTPDRAGSPKPRLACLGLRVLVAEDNAMNRKILAAQLDALGCYCTMAGDGEELLTALQQELLPDVVLMDCHMPNLDGWEATRRLRGWAADPAAPALRRQAAALPVIALTAAALPEERMRCRDAGMNDFLAKPVKLADLHRTLQPIARTGERQAV